MGWCQGRQCQPALRWRHGLAADAPPSAATRPPGLPVRLDTLAAAAVPCDPAPSISLSGCGAHDASPAAALPHHPPSTKEFP